MTRYLVLRENAETHEWIVIDAVDAANPAGAIRAFAENEGSATYVAVPERSWNPASVKVEQTTKISFGSGA